MRLVPPYPMFIKLNDHQHSLNQTTKGPTTHLKIRPKRPTYQGRNDQKMAKMTQAEMNRPKRPGPKRPWYRLKVLDFIPYKSGHLTLYT